MSRYAPLFKNPQGPGDARPTALQIVKDEGLINQLGGKVALVTGVSSGIGIETALAFKATGMRVIGAVRNIPKATEALKEHLEPGRLDLVTLDMNSLDSVRSCAAEVLNMTDNLNLLVNNAGTMYGDFGLTADGFERQFGTNHLAHFLLFELVKPLLLSSASSSFPSRVVSLSSIGHRDAQIDFDFQQNPTVEKYDQFKAYGMSKLSNVYFASELTRRYEDQNLFAYSVMPGGIFSGLQSNLPPELLAAWKADEEFMKAWKDAAQGAATSVWAAIGTDEELLAAKGRYLEDNGVAQQAPPPTGTLEDMSFPGYAAWAFDEEAAKKLWDASLKMVGETS